MRATKEYVEEKFRVFNALCFEGRLPELPIEVSHARRTLGQLAYKRQRKPFGKWVYSDFVLRISSKHDLPEAEVEDTIIHEMIHYYILWNQWQDTSAHGRLFRQMMQEINEKYGRHITISHKSTEAELNQDQQQKAHFLCVSRLKDGRIGITLAARTRVFYLWHNLSRYYDIEHSEWYGTKDPFFNRYPRAMKPKIYIIEEAVLQEHLEGAVKLKLTKK